jgi:hypothetical protein
LLVLIVIALTATASISAFFSRPDVTLDNAARLLVDDLLYAQSRAALTGTEVVVVFATDGRGYQVTMPGAGATSTLDEDARGRRYDADAVFEGVRIQSVQFENPSRVEFNPHGEAVEDGCVELSYESDVRTVRVERGRGLVYIPDEPCESVRRLR